MNTKFFVVAMYKINQYYRTTTFEVIAQFDVFSEAVSFENHLCGVGDGMLLKKNGLIVDAKWVGCGIVQGFISEGKVYLDFSPKDGVLMKNTHEEK